MAKQTNPFRRFRLIYRPSSPLLKCVVLAAIVLSTAAILVLRSNLLSTIDQTERLRAEAAALEQENRRIAGYIAEIGTVQSVKRLAEEKLGLVDPDSIFLTPVE